MAVILHNAVQPGGFIASRKNSPFVVLLIPISLLVDAALSLNTMTRLIYRDACLCVYPSKLESSSSCPGF
jgi:hypothetical protein